MALRNRTERSGDVCYDVLCAVADCHGIDPGEIDEQLSEVVNPDCLSSLWGPEGDDGRTVDGFLSFEFYDCRVTVRSDGTIEATPV